MQLQQIKPGKVCVYIYFLLKKRNCPTFTTILSNRNHFSFQLDKKRKEKRKKTTLARRVQTYFTGRNDLMRRKIVAQRYSLFTFGCTAFISHGNFLTDPRGNISHWRGIGFRPRIRGTRREPGNVRKGVANALLSAPVCERSDSTHVTIINSDCSMGMYIFACKREKCVRQRVLRLSRWQIQITSTKTPLPVYSKPHLGTGDENSPKRFLIYIYTCMYPR